MYQWTAMTKITSENQNLELILMGFCFDGSSEWDAKFSHKRLSDSGLTKTNKDQMERKSVLCCLYEVFEADHSQNPNVNGYLHSWPNLYRDEF